MNRPRVPTKIVFAAIIVLVFAGSYVARRQIERGEARATRGLGGATRIVSMAPSITETLFALGLGDRVVGVTRYCNYPPETEGKARVGGYLDPNFEAVVALDPDLVVMLVEHEQSLPAFDKLGLNTLVVRHKDVTGILESFPAIGRRCGREAEAQRMVADIETRIERIRRKTAGLARPRVMFTIERTAGSGSIEDCYIAGADGFFDKIIDLAGGQNAYRQGMVRFPVVSHEGILRMDPQVIVDMTPGLSAGRLAKETILADWQQLGQVEAVKNHRVHLMDHDYAFVPGPRFILLVEELARLIHPEVDWES